MIARSRAILRIDELAAQRFEGFERDQKTPAPNATSVDHLRWRHLCMTADNTYILEVPALPPFEAMMTQTTAVEFQRKFGEFQHKALREPVEITRHGRRELVLMSADHYDWLVAAARRTHRTADAAAVVIEAVERAEMDGEHAPLDELME